MLFTHKPLANNMKKLNYLKRILILIAFCCFSISHSQSNKKPIGYGSCENGTKRAIKDIKNKVYKSYSYGLVIKTKEEWEFSKFYKKHMKSKYGILIKDGGCVVNSESKCYSKKMKELIQVQFGKNIFERTREEAKKLYTKAE